MTNCPYILCVDDNPVNLELVEVYLEDKFVLQMAHNGQECLDLVMAKKPDLILLDVMMPVLNGIDTCKQLKNEPSTADIPIIVLSARSMESDVELMLNLGADLYLTKPFDQKILIESIEQALGTGGC